MGKSNPIAGTCYFKVDGAQYALKGKVAYNVQSFTRETVVGLDSVHGYTEKPVAPFIKGTFSDLGGISVKKLGSLSGVTVTAELKNGKTIILRDAWVEGGIEVDAEAGEYPVEFRGMKGEELL